jgi:uncharacterized membrane protein
MGLAVMILGLAVFIGTHLVTTQRQARANLIARFGENGYKALYSVLSLIGLVLIAYGFAQYRATGWIEIWSPPAWTRHLAALLVLFAVICIVAAYSPGHIKRVLKHPMLVGVKLWATAHLISNGDLGSIILFGSILGWAVFDRISLKRRTDPGAPPIAVGGWPRDAVAVIGGLVLYLGLGLWFHPYVIGVPAFSR